MNKSVVLGVGKMGKGGSSPAVWQASPSRAAAPRPAKDGRRVAKRRERKVMSSPSKE